jgi:hypothetical protein
VGHRPKHSGVQRDYVLLAGGINAICDRNSIFRRLTKNARSFIVKWNNSGVAGLSYSQSHLAYNEKPRNHHRVQVLDRERKLRGTNGFYPELVHLPDLAGLSEYLISKDRRADGGASLSAQ